MSTSRETPCIKSCIHGCGVAVLNIMYHFELSDLSAVLFKRYASVYLLELFYFSARFSPEDKYSRQRIIIKKRFHLLPTQKPAPVY